MAKFADVFGRVNAYLACVFLYCVGYIIVASSNGIVTYAVGNSIYILGISNLFLLQNVIISDISSLRNRCESIFEQVEVKLIEIRVVDDCPLNPAMYKRIHHR